MEIPRYTRRQGIPAPQYRTPRVPTDFAGPTVRPSTYRVPEMPAPPSFDPAPGLAVMGATARAAQAVGQLAVQGFDSYLGYKTAMAKLEAHRQAKDDEFEGQRLYSEAEQEFLAQEDTHKGQFDYKSYLPSLSMEKDRILQKYGSQASTPGAATVFDLNFRKFFVTRFAEGAKYRTERWKDKVDADFTFALDAAAKSMLDPAATPESDRLALERLQDAARAAEDVLPKKIIVEKMIAAEEHVTYTRAKRHVQESPATFVEAVRKGLYSKANPKLIEDLARDAEGLQDTRMGRVLEQERREREATERGLKDTSGTLRQELEKSAYQGKDIQSAVEMAGRALRPEDSSHLLALNRGIQTARKDEPSDEPSLRQAQVNIKMGRLTDAREVERLSARWNRKDTIDTFTMLQAEKTRRLNEGQESYSRRKQTQQQGEEIVKSRLRVPMNALGQFDPIAQELMAGAIQEYVLALDADPTVNPLDLANEIATRYETALDQGAFSTRLGVPQAFRFQTEPEVVAAYKAGTITEREANFYLAQIRKHQRRDTPTAPPSSTPRPKK